MQFPQVMTMSELAQYLQLPQLTLYQLAREGTIPGVKVGRHWRFHRVAVDQWLGCSRSDHPSRNPSGGMLAELGCIEAFDCNEHAALLGEFDVRVNQLTGGKFHTSVNYVKTPSMMIYEEYMLRSTEMCGVAPAGYITLATVRNTVVRYNCRSSAIRLWQARCRYRFHTA